MSRESTEEAARIFTGAEPPIPRGGGSDQRLARRSLVDKLAEAAWGVLNHDNDPHSGLPDDTHNWMRLCESIKAVLKSNPTNSESSR